MFYFWEGKEPFTACTASTVFLRNLVASLITKVGSGAPLQVVNLLIELR